MIPVRLCRLSRTVVAAAWLVAACSSDPGAQTEPSARPLRLETVAVPVDPENLSRVAVGRFTYAGGLELKPVGTERFGGLSDLEVRDGNRLLAVTDEGELFQARLVFDRNGRLTSLSDIRTQLLNGRDGRPLLDKNAADAEGLAVLPDGDRLVSFEREHRVWRYPAGGGPPVDAPAPDGGAAMPLNSGFEALAAFAPGGSGAYLVGSEGGEVWQCSLQAGCRATPLGRRVPDGYGLTALGVSPDGATVAVLSRAYDETLGVRAILRLVPRAAVDSPEAPPIDELALLDPLTRDNFEGVAIVAGANGRLRIYLLSDNNFSATQKTYLLAFDWAS